MRIMRQFHSYGPVDMRFHFGVERKELVERCVHQLVGHPDEGGHFFTIWSARQCGKTWLMRRAMTEIRTRYGDQFAIGFFSMQGLLKDSDGDRVFLDSVPLIFREGFGRDIAAPTTWTDWRRLFAREVGFFDRPLILLIDEFDALPPSIIDALVNGFRSIYLNREGYWLHGLALIGVRAVLGIDSPRGSPFNVQRSLHVPNLTRDEVVQMFQDYQQQSGQAIEPEVVETVYLVTRGQPGLVGWFGELLTEKYNETKSEPITMEQWERAFTMALQVEPNNTVLNLLKKARGPYLAQVMEVFSNQNIPFYWDQDWCNFLYTNGIIDVEETEDEHGRPLVVCRFSSPFIQKRLFIGLAADLAAGKAVLALSPMDFLADVFDEQKGLNAGALLERYKDYLKRLKAAGKEPFLGEQRRSDLGLREAVGHFHLYAWMREAVGRRCKVSPEFPTGNGKVDLFLTWGEFRAVIEVKSFRDAADMLVGRKQAARYAKSQGLDGATMALFVPVLDEEILKALSGDEMIEGVRVVTVAIGWG